MSGWVEAIPISLVPSIIELIPTPDPPAEVTTSIKSI